jgi:hypothetical protein
MTPGVGGSGGAGGQGTLTPTAPACGLPRPGRAPLRRLTRDEYNNTVRDLFGTTLSIERPADRFPPEEIDHRFDNNADALTPSAPLIEAYMDAAEQISVAVSDSAQKVITLVGCDPGAATADACVRAFIGSFGGRAWRRPLTAAELEPLVQLFTSARAKYDAVTGVRLVLQRLLQSPEFLYRIELGRPVAPGEKFTRLTSWEMASRLSYLIAQSMPDPELAQAAQADQLNTREAVAAQATRLLATPAARNMTRKMFAQWLPLDLVDDIDKDVKVFTRFKPTLVPLMRKEIETFTSTVMWQPEGGSLVALLTAPYTFVNPALATFYGLPVPTGTGFTRVELDPTQRSGLLTQAGVLAALAGSTETHPIVRGKFVREQLLCDDLPDPPPNVPPFPPPMPGLALRDRLHEHSSNPACSPCHRLMDPIGLGFEGYDAVGAFRTTEAGKPVDSSGELMTRASDGTELAQPFNGVVDLAHKLAASPNVHACMARQWFRFGQGRLESAEDACTLSSLQAQLTASNFNLRALIVALTQSDAFMYRPMAEGVSP